MTTMIKTGDLRTADREIRTAFADEVASCVRPKPAYLLRRDGQTDEYRLVGDKVVRVRHAGHITMGLVVNATDLPCVIS